ncbi:choline/carnitine O-acyltransferase [Marinisporobacter balticus]|uniref:Carnitine O-acetyltransferase n=1 Tax=Marinisporobacter balticus TaxID=2018667 RepID=A0A4R2KEF4_9FIRM|nr:choline/carnitine O-acyltransferase [Marinisporobacter balticus]TCO68298.1 carnitine O-acetyltransferase [Marinisporobacter balticus]
MKKTFANQERLPKIQIPKLSDTCDAFMEWVEPLLTKEAFRKTKEVVEEFKRKDGKKLQKQLIDWSEENNLSNWTAPLWKDIYLEPRDALIIKGNVFYIIKNKLKDLGCTQKHIATALTLSILRFKALIDQEELEVELQGGKPLCMLQYKKLFSTTRIPKREKDLHKTTFKQKHIIVLYRAEIFTLDVLKDSGESRDASEIEADLKHIIEESKKEEGQGIGILTTMNRDQWADTREDLLKIDAQNKLHLEKIEKAIFVLCLEDQHTNTLEEASNMMLYGNGKNRWYDKSLQFIISKNGEIGVNMEHTGTDGSIMSRFTTYLYENMQPIGSNEAIDSKEVPQKLTFHLNSALAETMRSASNQFDQAIIDTQTRILQFDQFGTELIKTFKVSPDAFVQLAIQLAQYKLYGKCYSEYEPIMTRQFLEGRIEVMYCVSNESMAFIRNILSNDCDHKTKVTSLIKATQKHSDRINECKNGKGVDGHLFGLLSMYKQFGKKIGMDDLPTFFKDKGYKTLTHSTVCTSTTSVKGIKLAGYGPIVDDGFAVRYLKDKQHICFNMTSRTHMKEKLDQLVANIEASLVEMADLMRI